MPRNKCVPATTGTSNVNKMRHHGDWLRAVLVPSRGLVVLNLGTANYHDENFVSCLLRSDHDGSGFGESRTDDVSSPSYLKWW